MTFPEFFQILVAAVGSIGFAILFNIRGRRLLSVAVGGGLCWLLFLLLNHW
ncbi:MAG: threonine/serine exporter family protein, partial [Clostridia bacterium]|nr:threonine/serine exporter family protein [Clostridia bacterium]